MKSRIVASLTYFEIFENKNLDERKQARKKERQKRKEKGKKKKRKEKKWNEMGAATSRRGALAFGRVDRWNDRRRRHSARRLLFLPPLYLYPYLFLYLYLHPYLYIYLYRLTHLL